ncbi:hypothetical protein AgCh_031023 [Apium graveolens]
MATDELLRNLLGKLDEIDKRTQKLVNSTESRFDAWDKILIKVKDSGEVYDPGIELAYFTGLGSIDDFVEWVTQVDKISAYTGWTEMRIFKIAALKLTKKAGLWFDNLNTKRVRSGKEKIMTWTSLKKKLRAKYILLHYKFECIMKMTSLSQGIMSVSEYTSEFYRLRLICDLEETETIKIGRFIRGLNLPIYRKVKSSPYISFNDVCNLALEFEYFQQDEKLKSSLHEFTLSEETKEEDFFSVENVVDLVADYHVLHMATTSSLDEKDEPVTKEAIIEKHEERQSLVEKVLIVEKDQIDASPKFVHDEIVEGQEILKETFETKEVVYKGNNIILVEHNDFLGIENLLNSHISSNYLILSSLLPKILLMELKFKAFKFYEKSPRYVLILKYFRTRGRVFFKGEENDEDQGMNMLIWIWLCMELPHWTDIVKAGTFKELAPYDNDWYYIRAASMASKIYLRGGLGVGAFRRIYGGSKRNGSAPPHFCKSSGGIARHILQQLQTMNIVDVDSKGKMVNETGDVLKTGSGSGVTASIDWITYRFPQPIDLLVVQYDPHVLDQEKAESVKAYALWAEKYGVARAAILAALTNTLFDVYSSNVYTAKALWDKLDQTHNTDSQGLEKYCMDSMVLPGKFWVMLMIEKLPRSWKEFALSLKRQKGEITWTTLMLDISVQEQHKSKQGHVMPAEHGSSKVNVVTVGKKRKVVTKKTNTKPHKNKVKKPKANKSCWSCGQVGHWSKDCPSKKAKKAGVVAQANTVLGLGTMCGPIANMVIGKVVASGTDEESWSDSDDGEC